jgi:hypothetical protein
MGTNDFSKRWKTNGDETKTQIPSLKISASQDRDIFYAFSEILVEKGDHVRLHDVRLDYDFRSVIPNAWHIHSAVLYLYAANLGILWRANKHGIDPDYLTGPPMPRSLTIGIRCEF